MPNEPTPVLCWQVRHKDSTTWSAPFSDSAIIELAYARGRQTSSVEIAVDYLREKCFFEVRGAVPPPKVIT